MKWFFIFAFNIGLSTFVFGQEDPRDAYLNTPDSLNVPIELEEVIINPHQAKLDAEAIKIYNRLQRRVYKVYPYAKATSATLMSLNAGMAKLKTAKERRKYFKIVEDYMQKQFEPQLKKLSRKDGQILVKLIHRQTGETTFNLIKDYKSGWKAFWSNNTARMFDINLKTKYEPYEVNEDYLIETIIVRGLRARKLEAQEPKVVVDYDDLAAFWVKKLRENKSKS